MEAHRLADLSSESGGPRPTYAVVWREGSGPLLAGKLELGGDALSLAGSGARGSLARCSIVYGHLAGVRIGRAPADRINGHPSVILDRRMGPPVSIALVGGLGQIFELGEMLAELTAEEGRSGSHVAVIVPIKPTALERVRELISQGPPFDLEQVPLSRHHVFVTEREVVFLFEGPDARDALAQLGANPGVWKAAIAWKHCLAGRPRVAEEVFSWAMSRVA